MNAYITFILLSISSLQLLGQNVVNNFSFESGDDYWNFILTVDYLYGGDYAQEGFVTTTNGTRCVGVRFYHETVWDFEQNYQEYIYQQFQANEMVQGQVYKVSFKYRLADRCTTATNSMGVGFFSGWSTDHDFNRSRIQQKVPELKNDPSHLLDNYDIYKEFVGYYQATGEEDWFAIGAFHQDSGMVRTPIPHATEFSPMNEILYFIDEVKIVPCIGFNEQIIEDPLLISCQPENISISANLSGATYLWSTGDVTQSINTTSGNKTIWVDATKNGCTVRDSVQIQLFSGPFDLGADIRICESETPPVLHVNTSNGETLQWSNGANQNAISAQAQGCYWVIKSLGDCSFSDTTCVEFIGSQTDLYPNPYGHTFTFSAGNEIWIKRVISEDGKTLFNGYESLESLKGLFQYLPTGQYYLNTEINGCEVDKTIIKITMP